MHPIQPKLAAVIICFLNILLSFWDCLPKESLETTILIPKLSRPIAWNCLFEQIACIKLWSHLGQMENLFHLCACLNFPWYIPTGWNYGHSKPFLKLFLNLLEISPVSVFNWNWKKTSHQSEEGYCKTWGSSFTLIKSFQINIMGFAVEKQKELLSLELGPMGKKITQKVKRWFEKVVANI